MLKQKPLSLRTKRVCSKQRADTNLAIENYNVNLMLSDFFNEYKIPKREFYKNGLYHIPN